MDIGKVEANMRDAIVVLLVVCTLFAASCHDGSTDEEPKKNQEKTGSTLSDKETEQDVEAEEVPEEVPRKDSAVAVEPKDTVDPPPAQDTPEVEPPATEEDKPSKKALQERIDSLAVELAKDNEEVEAALNKFKDAEVDWRAILKKEKTGNAFDARKKVAGTKRKLWTVLSEASEEGRRVVEKMDKYYPPQTKVDAQAAAPKDKPPVQIPVVFPKADAVTPGKFDHEVVDGDKKYLIHYNKFSLFAPDGKIYYPTGDDPWDMSPGGHKVLERGPDRTYLGRVEGKPHWVAIGYLREDGSVRGLIYTDRRQEWLDFEGHQVVRAWLDAAGLRDSKYSYSEIRIPGAGYGNEPVYRVPMGIDVSYNQLYKVGGSIPVLLETISVSQMEMLLTYLMDCRIHIPIKHMVIRVAVKNCPIATRWSRWDENKTGKPGVRLPAERFPGLTGSDLYKGGDKLVAKRMWPRIWPDHGCHKILNLNYGASAAPGGSVAATHLYPLVRPKPYHDVPSPFMYSTHTYIHEFSHTFSGDHNSGGEEGMSVYLGIFPGPPRMTGSQVMNYRSYWEAKTKEKNWPLEIHKDTSDVRVPPYACVDMVPLTDSNEKLVDVLANDWDYNKDRLTLVSVEEESVLGGKASVRNGKVSYTPPAYLSGVDRVKYRVADGTGWESTGYVIFRLPTPGKVFSFPDKTRLAFTTGITKKMKNGLLKKWNVGVPVSASLKFDVDKAGDYDLTLRYLTQNRLSNSSSRNIGISINGGEAQVVRFEGCPVATWHSKTLASVPLTKGTNSLALSTLESEPEIRYIEKKGSKKQVKTSFGPTTFGELIVRDGPVYTIHFVRPGRGQVKAEVLVDGEAFKAHDSGLEYGWNVAQSGRARNPFERGGKWEIKLPNGKYGVSVAVGYLSLGETMAIAGGMIPKTEVYKEGHGQPIYFNDLLVEGVPFNRGEHSNTYDILTGEVSVSDGRLTIEAGPKGTKTRIRYLDIIGMPAE